MNLAGIRRWVATADHGVARATRRTARRVLRARARLRSGTVTAEMDRIVAEACGAGSGAALSPELLRRRRSHARRRGAETTGGER